MDESKVFLEVIERLPDGIFVIDREGKVIAWNRALEKMTGVAKGDVLGKGEQIYAIPFYGRPHAMLIDLVLTRDREPLKLYESAEWKGDTLFAECHIEDAFQGKGVYYWGAASALFDSEGNLFGAVETIREISDWKKLEHSVKQVEEDLEANVSQLGETNIALKVVLKAKEDDRRELEKLIQANLKGAVLPYLDKLRKTKLNQEQRKYIDIFESALQEILSPFLSTLKSQFQNLTRTETHIANLIKEGKTSKEIARILGVVEKTIEIQRYNIRMKLGITNKKINLRSYLRSLE